MSLPCPYCRSTTFDVTDGLLTCENGHVQEGGQRAGEDEGDYHAAGRVNRKKIEKPKAKAIRVHRGPKGFRLFLKAWQFILWKQCHTLVHELHMPTTLWTVVKELWILRLSQLTSRLDETQEAAQQLNQAEGVEAESEFIAESEGGKRKRKGLITDNPTLWDTIGLSYLGILALRRPMHLSRIYDLIRNESICFIRAIRHVPQDIRDRLAPEYHIALDTITIPQQDDLQNAVVRISAMYNNAFGMVVPSLNWTSMLLSDIRELSLPLEVFIGAKHIARTAQFDFNYLTKTGRQRTPASLPEAQLMASLVVATKLLFPFDDAGVSPLTLNEPAALKMNWDKWLENRDSMRFKHESPHLVAREAIEVTDRHIMDMSEECLDQYMDWFQSTFAVEPRNTSNLNKEILDMFPLNTLPNERHTLPAMNTPADKTIDQRLSLDQGQLTSQQTHTQDGLQTTSRVKPGQAYQRFRGVQDLTNPALAFHRDAARLACIDLADLLRVVWHTERLLLLAQSEQRRREIFTYDDVDSDQYEQGAEEA